MSFTIREKRPDGRYRISVVNHKTARRGPRRIYIDEFLKNVIQYYIDKKRPNPLKSSELVLISKNGLKLQGNYFFREFQKR